MTTKERMLAAVRMEPVDRLPFWPKIYEGYQIARQSTCKGMSIQEIMEWIGCDILAGIPACIKIIRKNSEFKTKVNGNKKIDTFIIKSHTCTRISSFDSDSQSYHPIKMPVESIEDIKRMTEFYKDLQIELDEGKLAENLETYEIFEEKALVRSNIGQSPLMHFIEHIAGVENAHLFLHDYTSQVEELFEAMQNILLQTARITAEYSPADVLFMIENTSTTLISPQQFRQYCFKHIAACGEIIEKYDRNLALHMCGHLKNLLQDLKKIPARVFEAFTSPPVGNTTLLEGRNVCMDKCLFGGTNAVLWTKTADEIISELKKDLDVLPHHRGIILSTAGVIPPMCEPETIKKVSDFIKDFTVIM